MLSVAHLSKSFDHVQALTDLNFQVADGEILGLIGQNGAGKSTTFHSILNFLSYQGEITWNQQPISEATFNHIGYLPEERSLTAKLTIQDQVLYLARLKGLKRAVILPRLEKWMQRFAVKGTVKDKIRDLSKGNQQKVQLICTLIHEPDLIILDEPFSGLDPVNAGLLKNAILEEKQRGAAIIFSSHNMTNVEEICDQIIMLRNGETVLNGETEAVREQFGRTRIFLTTDWTSDRLAKLTGVEKVEDLGHQRYRLLLSDASVGPAIFDAVSGGKYITEFNQQPPSLDEIFRMEAVAHE